MCEAMRMEKKHYEDYFQQIYLKVFWNQGSLGTLWELLVWGVDHGVNSCISHLPIVVNTRIKATYRMGSLHGFTLSGDEGLS